MFDKNFGGLKLITKFIRDVWPEVDCRLNEYRNLLQSAEDTVLVEQALSSMKNKRFHAIGGSVYSLYPDVDLLSAVKFIVSLQTISDYLDNLCDRAGIFDELSFRQLHLAMLDAVDPSLDISDYYLYYPYKSDNGYLRALVKECRNEVMKLPAYDVVKGRIKRLAELYSSLQTYKHLSLDIREDKLNSWTDNYKSDYPDINSWEFSAATGSTLGMFVLFAAAHNPNLTEEEASLIDSAYFPWISALHILLDYYIDSDEDKKAEDLNFTHYYNGLEQCGQRLSYFIEHSINSCLMLRHPSFHLTVIRGILAMYLTDPKAFSEENKSTTRRLIKKGGVKAVLYFNLCRLLRHQGKL